MKRVILLGLLVAMTSNPFSALSKKYYVSEVGSESGSGTKSSPFLKIKQASELAMPGDTVYVLEGTYRERVNPCRGGEKGKPIVYMGETGKKVVIKGSNVWNPNWKKLRGGIYYAKPDAAMFDDVKEDYIDSQNPFEVILSSTPYERGGLQEVRRGWEGDSTIVYTCGQVFVNTKLQKEVAALSELEESGSWYYNPKNKSIYVNFGEVDPKLQFVEIATRRRIFAPSKRGLGFVTVQGFVMEHCGNQYPTNFWTDDYSWAQRGALGVEAGHDWIIRRNVVRYAKANAIDCGYVDHRTPNEVIISNNIIEENYIVDNGSAGILSNRSENMIIRNNVILRNNTMRFWGMKRWEHAGIKCHFAHNAYIHNNYIADQYLTDGIWMDNQFPDARISRNVIVNNEKRGIFLEMSDYEFDRIFIDNNIIIGNSQNAIYCHDASGATYMHNLIANTPSQSEYGQGLIVRQVDPRTKTYHHTAYNNIFAGNTPVMEFNYPSHRSGAQRFDYNVYTSTLQATDFHITSSSEIPRPWSRKEFYDKITEEVKSVGPISEVFRNERRVMLTFDQWKYFWKSHGCTNDEHSTLDNGVVVNYYPTSQEVSIRVNHKIEDSKSMNHRFVDVDYYGNKIKQDGKAKPGPFQDIKSGFNVFKVWDGLPIIGGDELPNFKEFNR